jgi:hypothetical protein
VRCLVLTTVLIPGLALAHATGISGYSGKQGPSCTQCHAGGTAPSVNLNGPAMLLTGASATYTLTISGGAGARAGFNAAQDSNATFIAGAGQKMLSGELTHSTPASFNAGQASFSFTVTAPSSPGTFTLYVAGNSVNNNTNDMGDLSATTRLLITVADPVIDAGAPPEMDAGVAPPVVGGGPGDGGSVAPVDMGSGGPGAGHVSNITRGVPGSFGGGVVDGGCSTTSSGAAFLLAALTLLSLRRRARVAARGSSSRR